MSVQEKATYAMGKEHSIPFNSANNLEKKHNVLDKMLHTFPTRKTHSFPGVCST